MNISESQLNKQLLEKAVKWMDENCERVPPTVHIMFIEGVRSTKERLGILEEEVKNGGQ